MSHHLSTSVTTFPPTFRQLRRKLPSKKLRVFGQLSQVLWDILKCKGDVVFVAVAVLLISSIPNENDLLRRPNVTTPATHFPFFYQSFGGVQSINFLRDFFVYKNTNELRYDSSSSIGKPCSRGICGKRIIHRIDITN